MRALVVVAAVLAAASPAGCTRDDEAPADTGAAAKLAWTRTFDLPPGRAVRRFAIRVPRPPAHTWEVRVTQPGPADVAVRIRTWYGAAFRVFESTAGADAAACRRRSGAKLCVARFPALEAQRGGEWTVAVEKRSAASAEVRVEIEFVPLEP